MLRDQASVLQTASLACSLEPPGSIVDGRDGSMSVCELPELTRGFNTDITQIQERDKTCADLTPEEWSAEAPIDESISGGLIIGSFPSNMYDYPIIGAYKWNEDKGTTRCVVDPARPDAPTEFIPVMVWGGAQDGFPWEPFKYTHYLGPDSDPDTAGPQGVCVDFTTWGAGFPSEFGTNYSSGRIVFTLPGNWSDVGCGAPTTPPTPSGEGCSDGARAAVTVAGLALLLQVIVLIVN